MDYDFSGLISTVSTEIFFGMNIILYKFGEKAYVSYSQSESVYFRKPFLVR